MNLRTRKFFGMCLLVLSLIVYPALASALYTRFLTGAPPLLLIFYFLVAGLGWAIPAGIIIKWMSSDPATPHKP